MALFWAMYHRNAEMQFKVLKASYQRSENHMDPIHEGLAGTHRTLRENILEAQQCQTKYAWRKEITFNTGDNVWHLTKQFQMTVSFTKHDYKCVGPYAVGKVIDRNAYTLDLPKTMRNHNVFHVSQLTWYTLPVSDQPSDEPHPMILDDLAELEVDRILDTKRHYPKLNHLANWVRYPYVRISWEPVEILGYSQEQVDEFHCSHPGKPH